MPCLFLCMDRQHHPLNFTRVSFYNHSMNVEECCLPCLKGLAERTVALSGGNEALAGTCFDTIERLWGPDVSPPFISNIVLKEIRKATGVSDPYRAAKDREHQEALAAAGEMKKYFDDTLEGVLKLASMGNSMDFFLEGPYSMNDFIFAADMAKIEKAIYNSGKDVLIIGDNTGDFIFDMPLAAFLEKMGKKVFYAVRERPVQNDLSMTDVERFGLSSMWPRIISTGTDEVGVKEEDLRGTVKELWEGDAFVIAKGMGNYETLKKAGAEGQRRVPGAEGPRVPGCGRGVLHVMKVKCYAVAHAAGFRQGTYIADLGGE